MGRGQGAAYIDFVKEVATRGVCDNGIYVLEDKKTWRHIPSLLEDHSDTICACCRFDVKTRNREPIAPEKRVHQCFDGYSFPVPSWAYVVIEVRV